MYIKNLDVKNKEIEIAIPLTKGTDKTRIKKRSIVNEYGIPVSTRQEPLTTNCYVEWQIGYDIKLKDSDKLKLTTLKDLVFMGANGFAKCLYELSEYIYYFYKWGLVSKNQLTSIRSFLQQLDTNSYIDKNSELKIKRSNLIDKTINNINFYYAIVEYPILIHKFAQYEIITEIIIKEKQYAVGVQPMLYFCFPITELKNSEKILNRVAEPKEFASFIINKNNISVFLEMLKIFGTLTENHKKDVISIIDTITK